VSQIDSVAVTIPQLEEWENDFLNFLKMEQIVLLHKFVCIVFSTSYAQFIKKTLLLLIFVFPFFPDD
jgi:hypothetical protein